MKPPTALLGLLAATSALGAEGPTDAAARERPRVTVTTDGEADEFEVEAIINSSSQFRWVGGQGWNAFHEPSWIADPIQPTIRPHWRHLGVPAIIARPPREPPRPDRLS